MGAESEQLKSALSLAERGFRVFRLRPGAKEPAFKGWQAEATSDPETIRRLWGERDYNIGVACGQGLVVLDVDVKNGKTGLESLAALGLDLETYTVETPSGGLHVYYEGPGVPNSAGRLGEGLDVRSTGGYVVGVGSVYQDRHYRLLRNGGCRAAPAEFIARCGTPKAPRENGLRDDLPAGAPEVELDSEAAVLRGRNWLRNDAPPYGSYAVAARLKDFGISEGVALELILDHWNERRPVPHTREAMADKVAHAYRYGQNPPGSDHPAAHFGDVEIVPPPRPPSPWIDHGEPFDPDSVDWNFFQLAPRQGVGVLSGASQSGKTFVCVEWGRCMATGKPFFGIKPDAPGAVIYLYAGTEGSGFELRLAALGEPQPLPISATRVKNLGERGALGELYKLIKDKADAMRLWHGVPLRMVILETLSASGLLSDENSNTEVARAIANLGQLAQMLDVLIVTTHHPTKEGKGQRGAGAIYDNVDYVWEIHREGREAVRKFDLTKARGAEQRTVGSFSLVQTVLGKDKLGRPVTSMAVSMGDAPVTSRTPPRMEAFTRALEFAALEGGLVEGRKQPVYSEVLGEFKSLVEDEIKDRANVHRTFRKCLDYALSLGAIEDQLVNGTRYLIRKEIVT